MSAIVTGRGEQTVKAEEQTVQDWKQHAGSQSGYAVDNLVRMFEYYDQWGLVGNPNVLRWLLKREPTSLEGFIARIATSP